MDFRLPAIRLNSIFIRNEKKEKKFLFYLDQFTHILHSGSHINTHPIQMMLFWRVFTNNFIWLTRNTFSDGGKRSNGKKAIFFLQKFKSRTLKNDWIENRIASQIGCQLNWTIVWFHLSTKHTKKTSQCFSILIRRRAFFELKRKKKNKKL